MKVAVVDAAVAIVIDAVVVASVVVDAVVQCLTKRSPQLVESFVCGHQCRLKNNFCIPGKILRSQKNVLAVITTIFVSFKKNVSLKS